MIAGHHGVRVLGKNTRHEWQQSEFVSVAHASGRRHLSLNSSQPNGTESMGASGTRRGRRGSRTHAGTICRQFCRQTPEIGGRQSLGWSGEIVREWRQIKGNDTVEVVRSQGVIP
jgi:hypothetical protein